MKKRMLFALTAFTIGHMFAAENVLPVGAVSEFLEEITPEEARARQEEASLTPEQKQVRQERMRQQFQQIFPAE